jgi:pilus assembly protein FimV
MAGVICAVLWELEINTMSRRLSRISLALVILLSSEVWAFGLGDIRMNSALNEPLRAEIELLSAAPDELDNLTIALASADTFERYGLDRPFYLQDIQFNVIRSGRADGNVVQVRSAAPMAEPFLTFLVEASWSRGRLLREYTVLLDPPTFAPPKADTAPAVQAPSRSAPTDSGRIERPAPTQQRPAPAPTPAPVRQAEPAQPKPQPVAEDTPYDTSAGGDYIVQRGQTLWGIASRVRPDSRLSMNQTMLAIFEANPDAFGGNINILRAGAGLRIPSADEIFQISRTEALAEAQRQHAAWSGGTVAPVDDASRRPSLILVPPDDDYAADDTLAAEPQFGDEAQTREDEIEQRIAELESADVPQQRSLLEIRDNELAALREELARIRGEVYEPPVDDVAVDEGADEGPFADDADILVDDTDAAADAEEAAGEEVAADADTVPADIIRAPASPEPSLVDRAMELLTSQWAIIAGALVLVGGLLFWFMRRGRDEDDEPDSWQPLDSDEVRGDELSATESLRAPVSMDESIVVVEQESTLRPEMDETFDAPAPAFEAEAEPEPDAKEATGEFDSLEDTFSSETAINLDQTDPVAEADFHMAYGLYDQAADLINGALSAEPERADLLTKLCEIYFVWGNRDAFIDAAGRLKSTVGDAESADWDKIVIMGQQIAADDELFAGASAAAATKEVDLSFEAGMDETGELDMELIDDDAAASDVVDLGADDVDTQALEAGEGVDFFVDSVAEETEVAIPDDTAESPTIETPDFDVTRELPAAEDTAEMPTADSTVETPTIEQQFDDLGGTAELPSLDETVGEAIEISGRSADETAEINVDDLGLDVDSLAETELASLDDVDATSESETLSDTGINEALEDLAEVTGKNPEVDPNATGVQTALSADDIGIDEALDVEDALAATSEMPSADADATGLNVALDSGLEETDVSTDVGLDESLLDATGVTQVLSEDLAVDTATDVGKDLSDDEATMLPPGYGDETVEDSIEDDAETLLAGLDDDDESDFDFAKTEALPKDVFTGDASLDETGELPAVASTDVDLDLDDLTAALKVSEGGDTVEQIRDDATVEQPRPEVIDDADDADDTTGTVSLAPDDMSDDLSDARTMTEVGTKLDLARAYVDMGDPNGARSILEEVLDEGDEGQRQQAQQLLDSLPS